MARPTSSEVPGWASCALTTTGQPAARADAVSPPATEKANGKLLAPNTATGPSGTLRWRISGRGNGVRSGWAGSMRAWFQLPSRSTAANNRSWPAVRPTSPVSRGRGRPVSAWARSTSASLIDSRLAAIASRNRALVSMGADRYAGNASAAAAQASPTWERLPYAYAGSIGLPVCGSTPRISSPVPRTGVPAISICPVRSSITVEVILAPYGRQYIHVQVKFAAN